MTEEELVEKVARAIYEGRNGHGCKPWSRQPVTHKDAYMGDATIALWAIRETHDVVER